MLVTWISGMHVKAKEKSNFMESSTKNDELPLFDFRKQK